MRELACQAVWDAFGADWPSYVAPMQKTGMTCLEGRIQTVVIGRTSLLSLTLARTLINMHFCYCECLYISTLMALTPIL